MLRIHASYHKCLTMYFLKTAAATFNKTSFSIKDKYKHFESIEGLFYNTNHHYYLSSTNGFAINIDNLKQDFRITRFIRDPRDLIISGYFYHKRGAEPWFRFKNPTNQYWSAINGNIPEKIPVDISYSEYLNTLPIKEGLKAEIDFRKYHFESMRQWQEDDRIKLFKYEDIINNQIGTFEDIANHLEIKGLNKSKFLFFAKRYALRKNSKNKHVRNPNPNQWKDYFDTDLNNYFIKNYGDILERYDYDKAF